MTSQFDSTKFTPADREEQRIEALRAWMSGATYRQIADQLDVGRSTAYDRVQQALDAMRPHADFDRYRAEQLAEMEMARRQLRRAILAWTVRSDDPDGLVKPVTALMRLQDRQAKLLGLDAPEVDRFSQMSDAEIEAEMERMEREHPDVGAS